MHLQVCGGEKKREKHTYVLIHLAGRGEPMDTGARRAHE
jgi:hypothetical protein